MDIQLLIKITLGLIIFILILFHYCAHGTRLGQLIDRIPGPRWYPIIGNILDILVPVEYLWHFYRQSGREFYPVYKIWVGHWPVVVIRHPDDIEIILRDNKNISKSKYYELLHPWLKDGLLTSTGDKWRIRRKIITPAFHLNNLQAYSNNIIELSNSLIDKLKEESEFGSVTKELLPMVSRFTLNILCETIMGMSRNENDVEKDIYRRAVHDTGDIFYYRSVRPWLKNNWIFFQTKKGHDQSNSLKILHAFTTKMIKQRMRHNEESDKNNSTDFSISSSDNSTNESLEKSKKKRLDFLDILIDASKRELGIDIDGIREEMDTFVFEGHDTSAMSILFTILLLAEHKDIQTRARNEINIILEESNGIMTMNEIQRFDYLECCIKESLRLYPGVPLISRNIEQDLQLKHCFVPKGAILNISIFDVHRDPNYWPRPNIYDPDRFLPENMNNRHPFSYIPFSHGPRNCIGRKFAMIELKAIIAGLLHNFYLEPLEVTANIRVLPDIVLRSDHPVYVKFIPITK